MVHIQKKSLKKDMTAKFSQHQIPFQYKGKIKMNLISNQKKKKTQKRESRGDKSRNKWVKKQKNNRISEPQSLFFKKKKSPTKQPYY